VTRTGDTTTALTVYYSLGGKARNGIDYKMLPGWVTIPAGSASTDITVTPILDIDSTPETNDDVVLQLRPLLDFPRGRPNPSPSVYSLGWPSNAVVVIAESKNPPTNRPPVIQLVSPVNNAGFLAPGNVQLVAQAYDRDGTIASVEFFAATSSDTNSIGTVANPVNGRPYRDLFSLVWTNPPPGNYTITAQATDNDGATTMSSPASIQIFSAANIPTVTVIANPTNASEVGPVSGTFIVSRTGDMSGPLSVYYSLSGTARNGVDYQRLSGVVNFLAGAPSTNITVTPILDFDPIPQTNDTVELTLTPLSQLRAGMQGLYQVGSPSNAVITITEGTNLFPVVTVVATDPSAAEDPLDTGTFTVTRTGDTNSDLTVFYSLGGSARNGRDYQMLPGSLTIPAGTNSAEITVTPIFDRDTTPHTNDTVVLQLHPRVDILPPILQPPAAAAYAIGWPSNAVVTITESTNTPPNQPPVVRLLTPTDGAGFVAPATIQLVAQAQDSDGTVSNVVFYAATSTATNDLGTITNKLSNGRYRGQYSLIWSNVDVGNYTLSAVATDNQGASSTSAPVHVVVTATALPTVTIFASDPLAVMGTNSLGHTNVANFVVRRTDGTNADLVVYYTISGTASNGVDYVKLPGSVTIPAGQRTVNIELDPLVNPNTNSGLQLSAILTLQAPPVTGSNPPTYLVGRPNQAVAIILERAPGRSTWVGNGFFQVILPTPQAATYQVQVSSDLVNWDVVGSKTTDQGSIEFVDPDSANAPLRFYRTVPDPSGGDN
jgi:hypothetical protein